LLTAKEAISYAEQAGTYSVSELRMLSLEYKLDNEGLTEAEYGELATLYEELGFVKCERDILELAYKMFGNEEVLNKLQGISVNLAEEDDSIVAEMNLLLFDLSTEERLAEVVHAIESDEWIAAMMPRLGVGKRTYFREKNGVVDFSVEAGYNEASEAEAVIRFLPDGSLGDITGLIIVRSAGVIKVYEEVGETTGSVNDIGSEAGDKTFVLKTIDTDAGTVRTEEGTVKDGKFTGEYKVTIAQAASKAEPESKASAFDLYNNCETLPVEVYTGEFDEDGATTLEEPSAKNIKAFADSMSSETVVVYAYNESKTKCLYKGLTNAEKEAGASFGTAEFDFPESLEIQYYDVKDKSSYSLEGIIKIANGAGSGEGTSGNSGNTASGEVSTYISAENLKVRIYGGEIQVYNGYAWISMGDAKEIAEADPFENGLSGTNGAEENTTANGSSDNKPSDSKSSAGVGNITTETQVAFITSGNKTNTTSNNSGNKTNQSSNSGQNTQTSNNGGQTATTPSQSSNNNSNPSGGSPAVNNPTPEPQQPSTPEPSTPDPGTQEPSGNDSGSSENGGGENSGGGEPAGDGGGNDSDVEYSPDID